MPLLKLHHISFRVMAVAGCIEWVKMTRCRHSRLTAFWKIEYLEFLLNRLQNVCVGPGVAIMVMVVWEPPYELDSGYEK